MMPCLINGALYCTIVYACGAPHTNCVRCIHYSSSHHHGQAFACACITATATWIAPCIACLSRLHAVLGKDCKYITSPTIASRVYMHVCTMHSQLRMNSYCCVSNTVCIHSCCSYYHPRADAVRATSTFQFTFVVV